MGRQPMYETDADRVATARESAKKWQRQRRADCKKAKLAGRCPLYPNSRCVEEDA